MSRRNWTASYNRDRLIRDISIDSLHPPHHQEALCTACSHPKSKHDHRNGGCWQELSPGKLCLCKKYQAR